MKFPTKIFGELTKLLAKEFLLPKVLEPKTFLEQNDF